MVMKIPLTITNNKDELKFLYRAIELLRLEHNEKAKEMSLGSFRDYQRNDFEPRNQRLFFEINLLKEKLDLVRNYGDEKKPSPNLKEASDIKEEGKNRKEFDVEINLKEI